MKVPLLVLFAAFLAVPSLASARDSGLFLPSVQLDHALVRHGNPADFDASKSPKVATVRSKEVYKAIPAYQTIQKEKVQTGTARYTQLMQAATKTFRRALKASADKGGYLLIVEEGGISGYTTTDLTAGIIRSL